MTLVLYPAKNELSSFQRIGLSIVFSIGSVMLIVLFIDEVLAVNTTPANIGGAVLIFSLLAVIIWKAEMIFHKKVSKYLVEHEDGNLSPLPSRIPAFLLRSKSKKTDSWEKRILEGFKK